MKNDLSKVTRIEVIDANGRSYVNLNAAKVKISVQDDGLTMKVFTGGKQVGK